MTALEDDELQLKRVHEWNLPTDPVALLAWLRFAKPGAASDAERWAEFKELPAFTDAPDGLAERVDAYLTSAS